MDIQAQLTPEFSHTPVMLAQVLSFLNIVRGHKIIDATYGDGHYTRAFLAKGAEVFAFDKDPEAILAGQRRQSEEKFTDLHLIDADFGSVVSEMQRRDTEKVDAIVFDLGVSSRQLDDSARGFSVKVLGPLDMRMSKQGLSAREIVNGWDIGALASLLRRGGETAFARVIARAIVRNRQYAEIADTQSLAKIIAEAIPLHLQPKYRHPATLAFQALRIEVNQEILQLQAALHGADRLLKQGGRLIAVSFHSLEDKIVMRHLRRHQGGSRHLPEDEQSPRYRLLTRSCLTPDDDEIQNNVRARSARMRVAEKCSIG